MLYALEFYGGPKDGEVCYQNITPAKQLFCASNETPLLNPNEFRSMDDKYHDVRQTYFRYDLKVSNQLYHRYEYAGLA